jgi:16S rRNA (guanine966-N2)-methyltransferase
MTRIIGGTFSSLRLKTPKGPKTRPTQDAFRELVFNLLQCKLENACFLDLCAGSGAIGLEALSRGASKAYLVDMSSEATRCIKENITHLKVESQAHVLKMEALKALKYFSKNNILFSHIYIDPPYEAKLGNKMYLTDLLLQQIDTYKLLQKGGVLMIEEDAARKFSQNLDLSYLSFSKVKVQGKSQLRYYTS